MAPTLSQIIMGFVGLAVTFLGVVLSQIGKRGDQAIQQNKDQFQRLIDEAKYWHDNADGARDDLESFRDRQLKRCRAVTESAYTTISELLKYVPEPQRRQGDRTLDEITNHQDVEHPTP